MILQSFGERIAKLEPRERRMLGGLALAFGLLFALFLPAYLYSRLSAQRDENEEIKEFLDKVEAEHGKIAEKQASREVLKARYEKPMPQLATFMEQAAKANGVEIDESSPKPDVPHGKKKEYVERVQTMKLRKVGLLGLVKMLEKIERSGLPVALTRLSLKPRSDGPDSYDVEAAISAYELKDAPKKAQPAKDEGDEEEEETP